MREKQTGANSIKQEVTSGVTLSHDLQVQCEKRLVSESDTMSYLTPFITLQCTCILYVYCMYSFGTDYTCTCIYMYL